MKVQHKVPIYNKMYVLKNVAHELRAECFKESEKPKKKFQAMAWQKNITTKEHIADMGYEEVVSFISELYCKKKYKHSASTLAKEYYGNKVSWGDKGYYKKIIKIKFLKVALFFGAIKLK